MSLFKQVNRTIVTRYILLQVPGIIIFSIAVFAGVSVAGISHWYTGLAVMLWIIKDIIMFPLTWKSYSPHNPHGVDALLGSKGTVQSVSEESIYVRIGMELWKARCPGYEGINPGDRVEVTGNNGLELIIKPAGSTGVD